jgi:hypothetical protein
VNRLLHHSVVINIRGNSYRLKGKLLKKVIIDDRLTRRKKPHATNPKKEN